MHVTAVDPASSVRDPRATPGDGVTAIILTFNEAIHVVRAIRSVRAIAQRVVIVDSFSTDATVALAQAEGAEVLQHPFVNQALQFRWAMEQAAIATPWILRLDADETIDPPLADEIRATLPTLSRDVTGINLKRRHVFMGRWVRHGGRYPLLMLRLFRTGAGQIEQRWMDEHITVTHGRTITLAAPFTDENLRDLAFFTDKHNRYATREALQVILERRGLQNADTLHGEAASRQAAVKRWIKTRIYNRIPFPLAALAYFLGRYLLQLGFLDGMPGLVYHGLQGFWYRFLVGARTRELELALASVSHDREATRRALLTLTGLDIDA